MALAASKRLSKKMIRENKTEAFHSKVVDAVSKGHTVMVTSAIETEYRDYPKSYQLINQSQ